MSSDSSDDEADDEDLEPQAEGQAETFEIDDQEIVDLTNMVEDMIIPQEAVKEPQGVEAIEDGSEDSDSESDDEAPKEVPVSEIIQEEMLSEDDEEEYNPGEAVEAVESSDDSYESAISDSDSDNEETMDE